MGTLLLPLSGCYVEQPAAYPGPAYPPSAAYDPNGDPGYGYNGAQPTIMEGGFAFPLVLLGGEWGYYDRDRHWHRAPEETRRRLQEGPQGEGPIHSNAAPGTSTRLQEARPLTGRPWQRPCGGRNRKSIAGTVPPDRAARSTPSRRR